MGLQSTVNLMDSFSTGTGKDHGLWSTATTDDFLGSSMRSQQNKPPITFKAHPVSRHAESSGLDGSPAILNAIPAGPLKPKLPPIQHPATPDASSSDYQTQHHTFIPKMARRPSGYARRVAATHPPPPSVTVGEGTAVSAAPHPGRAAALAVLRGASRSAPASGALQDGGTHQQSAQVGWGASSIGDLEALDSILDQLVVLDSRMRTALLKGPLISFETVVPEQRAAGMVTGFPDEPEHRDNTFITGVKGIAEDGAQEDDQEEERVQPPSPSRSPPPPEPSTQRQPSPPRDAVGASYEAEMLAQIPEAPGQRDSWGAMPNHNINAQTEEDLEALRATIPVPILPKLARLYITSKTTSQVKAAPPPPPTADFLLRTRPPPAISAPSYDQLCGLIRDVQRQYTCGTGRERGAALAAQGEVGRPQRLANNLDMYISGLDGPALDEVIAHQDLPAVIERSRPSFVSMKRTQSGGGKHRRARSTGRGRSLSAGPGGGVRELATTGTHASVGGMASDAE